MIISKQYNHAFASWHVAEFGRPKLIVMSLSRQEASGNRILRSRSKEILEHMTVAQMVNKFILPFMKSEGFFYRVHKIPQLDPNLIQLNPIDSKFLKDVIRALLGYYAAYSGKSAPTFLDNHAQKSKKKDCLILLSHLTLPSPKLSLTVRFPHLSFVLRAPHTPLTVIPGEYHKLRRSLRNFLDPLDTSS
jgi:hypothetical protein